MSANVSLLLVGLLTCLSAFAFGRARWRALTMLDVYVLFVAAYFGAYSIVDACVNDVRFHDPIVILWVFALVACTTALAWALPFALPRGILSKFDLRYLASHWSNVNGPFVIGLFLAVTAFTAYGYMTFGIISHLSEEDANRLGLSFPYWFTSAKVFVQPALFFIFVSTAEKRFSAHGAARVLWGLVAVFTVVLSATYGRRSILTLIVVYLILASFSKNRNPFSMRNAAVLFAVLVVMIGFSNLYQNYRNVFLKQISTKSATQVLSPVDAALDMSATLENLRIRMAMWQFNYMILDKQTGPSRVSPAYGEIFVQAMKNSVPSVLNARKKVRDLDALLATKYGFPVTDYPTNSFAVFQADFGYLSVAFLPTQIAFLLTMVSLLAKVTRRYRTLTLLLMGMTWYYLINIENSYADFLLLFRNMALVSLAYLGGHLLHQGILLPFRSRPPCPRHVPAR